MKELEVSCITRSRHATGHEHITQIGNNANRWRLSHEIAIQRIETKVEAYYTVSAVTKRRAYIGVVRTAGNAPYLRAFGVDGWNNDLLALDECGGECVLVA
ncbi:DUF3892 domain-containing protein [Variovorax sp. RHLX14]|uniref:DUF3892 domain-containing protein n=1 Tax=Variovorax sp. RHLX14 TaxID=1259731 RepID=UPI003F45A394